MYKALNPGVVGISAPTLDDAMDAATEALFHAIEINPAWTVHTPTGDIKQKLDTAKLKAAAWGLPGSWRGDEAAFEQTLKELPGFAQAAAELDCTRVYTWILPASDELDFQSNWDWHVSRLKPLAKILAEHGCRLGLEYVGPLTARKSKKHAFVYNMEGMMKLAEAIGPNVGLMLDSWHWYTAGETSEQIKALASSSVVHVHVNDAPKDVAVEDQLDHKRELPGATGVIDIVSFLTALQSIGYDGPVTPEPFNQALKDLPSDEDRLEAVGYAMDKIWQEAGLTG